MFWVISVYFSLRNIIPKSGTFPPGHTVCAYARAYVCVDGREGVCTHVNVNMRGRSLHKKLKSLKPSVSYLMKFKLVTLVDLC